MLYEVITRYYPSDRPNYVGLEGFFNAMVLVEGLKLAGRDLTREGFIRAVESMTSFPLAESVSTSFSPSDHQGLDRIYFTRLKDGTFGMLDDWGEIAAQMNRITSYNVCYTKLLRSICSSALMNSTAGLAVSCVAMEAAAKIVSNKNARIKMSTCFMMFSFFGCTR